jgi:hypothetical protein
MINYTKCNMKKLFIILLFLLLSLVCIGQNQQYQQTKQSYKKTNDNFQGFQTHTDYNGKHYNWEMIGDKCYNCASFYIKTMRSTNPENGYYTYYIFLFSNSYDRDGYLSNTYLKNVDVYTNRQNEENFHLYHTNYILINKKDEISGYDGVQVFLTFESIYAFERVNITWQDLTIY